MANVIPMAGLGSRFAKEGYVLPKALVPVSGKPMISRAIELLPESDTWFFVVREEHIKDFAIDALIQTVIPHAVVLVDEEPHGQASACALALPHLDPEESVFIAACDNSFLYNKDTYASLVNDATVDAIVWTFTNHPSLSKKPESWGWTRLEDDGLTIKEVSVKVPISDTPFNDHAVVGAFYFRRSADFKAAYKLMVADNHRINGEFYVDSMPYFYKKLNKRSVIFDVDLYVGWGKPEDLYLYQKWEYIVKSGLAPDESELHKWKTFIHSLS